MMKEFLLEILMINIGIAFSKNKNVLQTFNLLSEEIYFFIDFGIFLVHA